jgi:hypothetical protein
MQKLRKLFLILLLSIIASNELFCQKESDGIYFEINFLSAKEHISEYKITSWNPFQSERSQYDERKFDTGVSFGFSGKINISKVFSINYRPGITVNNNHYTFADLGIYLRSKIVDDFFAGLGITSKLCLTQREGNMSYTKPRSESFEYTIMFGYHLTNKINLLVSINDTFRDEYGESYSNSNMNSIYIKKYVYWIAKVGIEYSL